MSCLGPDATADCIDELRNAIRELPTNVLRARLDLLRSLDESTDAIPEHLPILCLQPVHDRLVLRNSAAIKLGKRRYTRVQHIEGPHFLLQMRPDACRDAIAQWMDEVLTPQQ
jgi:hypothetical protein